ncbi:MAG: hypothetical protein ABIK28_13545 [Planctomycetota bacterium]
MHLNLNLFIFVFLWISLHVSTAEESPMAKKIDDVITNLNSRYYIKRDQARSVLEKREKDLIDFCIHEYDKASHQGKALRLDILTTWIPDERCNDLAWADVQANEPALRFAAIKYLAAHPEKNNQKYIDWSRELLLNGSGSEKSAYFLGIRKPAPNFQVKILIEHMGMIEQNLKSLALKSVIKGWRKEASFALGRLLEEMENGSVDREGQLEAMHLLGEVAGENACPLMLRGLLSASYDLRKESSRVAQQIIGHLFRAQKYEQIVDLHQKIHTTIPGNIQYALDYADSLIQYQDNSEAAMAFLKQTDRELTGKQGTEASVCLTEVQMGLSLAEYWSGGYKGDLLTVKPSNPKELKGSYALRRALARKELLRGALILLSGGDGRSAFRSALEIAPYDPDYAEIDALFTGRFSISNIIWRLNRAGQETYSKEIFQCMVDVLKEDPSGCAYYPSAEESSYSNDRIRSGLPLNEAYFLLHNCGEPEAAYNKLAVFIESIRDSTLFTNRDLLARAYYYQGLAAADLGRPNEAFPYIKRGIKTYEALEESIKACSKNSEVEAAADYYHKEKSRGLLYLASLTYYFLEDAEESARLGRQAVMAAPDFDAPILTHAIEQARCGEFSLALDLLENMEPYPDRYYNFACLHCLIGNSSKAVEFLRKHFKDYLPPMRTSVESDYAKSDPDLRALEKNEDFIRMVNAKN